MKERLTVRAKRLGYYGDARRKEGDVFDLVEREVGEAGNRRKLTIDQQFSDVWMEKIDEDGNPVRTKPSQSAVTENSGDVAETHPSKGEKPVAAHASHSSSHDKGKSKRGVI